MLKIIRQFFKSMRFKWGRLQLRTALLRNIPGIYGVIIRTSLLQKHFAYAGDGLKVHEGFRFRNIHKIAVGDNVTLGVDSFIQGGGNVEIGDDVIISQGVKIITFSRKYENRDMKITDQGIEYKNIVIGNDVLIEPDAVILPGTVLGDGVVVRAGAVVDNQIIEPYTIIAGNPARVTGGRLSPDNQQAPIESDSNRIKNLNLSENRIVSKEAVKE